MVDVDVHRPCHTVTPWDRYGGMHQRETIRVLKAAGIDSVPLYTHERILAPQGTGPGGRVRFGDDMMPGVYRVAVKAEDLEKATAAIAAHKQAIQDWIAGKTPMPDVCLE